MGPSLSYYPHPKADITEELVGDELFLFSGESREAVHCLNSGAALIWYLCDGTRDAQTIGQELATAFDLPAADVLVDVSEALSRLTALGLLEMDEPVSVAH